jgi:tRNA(Ile)-lysidine synthase
MSWDEPFYEHINLENFQKSEIVSVAKNDDAVAVAVSGGPDSMALCYLLAKWSEKINGPQIHAITVDHGLRPESHKEANEVAQLVKTYPRCSHTILLRVPDKKDTKIMESARQDRYKLIERYCSEQNITKVFVAHHLDDQLETFLFRLSKGSGLDGLCVMGESVLLDSGLTVCRPFLRYYKQGLVDFCTQNSISYIEDPTNENEDFARARLRNSKQILENEGLSAKRIGVTALRMARARQALSHYAELEYAGSLISKDRKSYVFDFNKLNKIPEEIIIRIFQNVINTLAAENKDYGVRLEKLETLVRDMFSETPFRRRTLAGCIFTRNDRENTVILEQE